MAQNDCSLLAAMSSDRDLIGAVSWELIAKARVRMAAPDLKDATLKPASVARCDDELLTNIDMIEKHGFFFVRDTDDRVCGLVTAADLTAAYRRLTTPYFQLGEIERYLRHCINTHFSTDQTRAAVSRNKNRINSADDMEFGQYKVPACETGLSQHRALSWTITGRLCDPGNIVIMSSRIVSTLRIGRG